MKIHTKNQFKRKRKTNFMAKIAKIQIILISLNFRAKTQFKNINVQKLGLKNCRITFTGRFSLAITQPPKLQFYERRKKVNYGICSQVSSLKKNSRKNPMHTWTLMTMRKREKGVRSHCHKFSIQVKTDYVPQGSEINSSSGKSKYVHKRT